MQALTKQQIGLGTAAISISLLGLVRNWAAGGACSTKDLNKNLKGKVIIITGSNTGIGYETALQLAKQGATICVACRPSQKTHDAVRTIREKSKNEDVFASELELDSMDSIRAFAERWIKSGKPIHILINNAGVMAIPERRETKDGFEMQMGTNHLGHFLLTELLLETIKSSAPARIINLSSISHSRNGPDSRGSFINFDDFQSKKDYAGPRVYSRTKLANILYTDNLAKRLSGTGVTANSLHPGVVRTELIRHVNIPFYAWSLYPIAMIVTKTPWEGAQTTLHVALSDECSQVTGKYFADCVIKAKSAPQAESVDAENTL
ncbi:hypothetical protein SmJEL517_g05924 [Synchytrium microbalum]|uniref:Uncharacterized protein n=1 Tax=Synchytrium microbalum TaxID=1806994 RepID=A0A507BZ44_9FUNG|nr:uncharacterized protein SmJEL517_g05924 [Synchytrium microbalum]TPX30543.1 hypothetical protein SmJEL517_g05924 [Synchytrium microbalum]